MTKKDLLLLVYIMKIKKLFDFKEKSWQKKKKSAQFGDEYKCRIEGKSPFSWGYKACVPLKFTSGESSAPACCFNLPCPNYPTFSDHVLINFWKETTDKTALLAQALALFLNCFLLSPPFSSRHCALSPALCCSSHFPSVFTVTESTIKNCCAAHLFSPPGVRWELTVCTSWKDMEDRIAKTVTVQKNWFEYKFPSWLIWQTPARKKLRVFSQYAPWKISKPLH